MQRAEVNLTSPRHPAEVWRVLLGPRGLCASGSIGAAEDAYTIETAAGDVLLGAVRVHTPGEELVLLCANMEDAVLTVRTRWDAAAARTEVALVLDAAGVHHDDVESFALRWRFHLRDVLA